MVYRGVFADTTPELRDAFTSLLEALSGALASMEGDIDALVEEGHRMLHVLRHIPTRMARMKHLPGASNTYRHRQLYRAYLDSLLEETGGDEGLFESVPTELHQLFLVVASREGGMSTLSAALAAVEPTLNLAIDDEAAVAHALADACARQRAAAADMMQLDRPASDDGNPDLKREDPAKALLEQKLAELGVGQWTFALSQLCGEPIAEIVQRLGVDGVRYGVGMSSYSDHRRYDMFTDRMVQIHATAIAESQTRRRPFWWRPDLSTVAAELGIFGGWAFPVHDECGNVGVLVTSPREPRDPEQWVLESSDAGCCALSRHGGAQPDAAALGSARSAELVPRHIRA